MADPPPHTLQASLATLANSILSRPLGSHRPAAAVADDDDDEPLFYSAHPAPSSASLAAPPTVSADAASVDSLFRTPLDDSSPEPAAAAVVADYGDEQGDDDDDGADALFGPASRLAQERHPLAAPTLSNPSASISKPSPASASRKPPGSTPLNPDGERRTSRGWLAHQSAYPAAAGGSRRRSSDDERSDSDISESTVSSSTSDSGSYTSSSEDGDAAAAAVSDDGSARGSPLAHSLLPRAHRPPARGQSTPPRAEPPPSLAASRGVGRSSQRGPVRKFHDPLALALFLASMSALGVLLVLSFVGGGGGSGQSTGGKAANGNPSPFLTLLRALPLLTLLVLLASLAPPLLLYGLRRAAQVVFVGSGVAGVLGLVGVAWGAGVGSLEGEGWWGTTGLRILALPPLLAAVLYGRALWKRRASVSRTVRVVELACDVLLARPALLLLTPALLLAFGGLSIVFLTVWVRLFLIGWWESPGPNSYHYHLKPHAVWLLVAVGALWVWAWSVVRGLRRVVVAGVVGEWYFHRDEPPSHPPSPDPLGLGLDTADVRAAWARATGRSAGSVCLGAAVGGGLGVAKAVAVGVKRSTSPTHLSLLPPSLSALHAPLSLAHSLAQTALRALEGYNELALVYVGLQGVGWGEACWGVRGLLRGGGRGRVLDYSLLSTLLSALSLALSLLAALTAYLSAPALVPGGGGGGHAPVVALVAGGAVWGTVRFGVGGVGDAADALFLSHLIDAANGGGRCAPAFAAFGDGQREPSSAA